MPQASSGENLGGGGGCCSHCLVTQLCPPPIERNPARERVHTKRNNTGSSLAVFSFRREEGECDHYTKGRRGSVITTPKAQWGGGQCGGPDGMLLLRRHRLQLSPTYTVNS